MELEVIRIAASQGIWAVLSILLIFFILKNQQKRDVLQTQRENNYQSIIEKLTERLDLLNSIKEDLAEIKNVVEKGKR